MTISQRRDRLRRRLAGRRTGRDAGSGPGQRALSVRIHRFERRAVGSAPTTTRRCWQPTGATARRPRRRRRTPRSVIERACGPHLAGRAAAAGVRRLGFESHVVTVDAFAAAGAGAPASGAELVRAGGHGRGAARGQGCRRDRAAAAGLRGGRRGAGRPGGGAAGCGRAAPRRRSGATSSRGCSTTAPTGCRSRPSWPPVPTRRSRTTGPTDAVLAAGDFVKIDFGALVARLPLGHDPHVRAGAGRAVAARHLRPGGHRAAGRPRGAGARGWR